MPKSHSVPSQYLYLTHIALEGQSVTSGEVIILANGSHVQYYTCKKICMSTGQVKGVFKAKRHGSGPATVAVFTIYLLSTRLALS